jgi:alpha-D-ribose 1-methylphosphonate 5-triphosphate diphosphatase PhnM
MVNLQSEKFDAGHSTIIGASVRVGLPCLVCGKIHKDNVSIAPCRGKYLVDFLMSQHHPQNTQRIIIEKIIARLENSL